VAESPTCKSLEMITLPLMERASEIISMFPTLPTLMYLALKGFGVYKKKRR
jgi:hypothetical protein